MRRPNDTREERPFWEKDSRAPTVKQHEKRYISEPTAAPSTAQRSRDISEKQNYNASPWPVSSSWRRSEVDDDRRKRPAEPRPIPVPLGGLSKNQMLGSIKDSWGEEPEGTGMFTILPDPPSRSTSPFQVRVRDEDEQPPPTASTVAAAAATSKRQHVERETAHEQVKLEGRVERKPAPPWERRILSETQKPPMSPGEEFFGPKLKQN